MHIVPIRETLFPEITANSIVWISDVFDRPQFTDWFSESMPAYIVNDMFVTVEQMAHKVYCAPLWLAKTTTEMLKNLPEVYKPTYNTTHAFNFIINKKQVNRFLCMKLVEIFGLSCYDYTWSGIDVKFDLTDILDEITVLDSRSPITQEQLGILLADVQIPSKFIHSNNEKILKSSHVTYPGNPGKLWTWLNGLDKIFSESATSLITESLSFEKSTVFTEKTIYAVLGKTFPIWVGGGILQAQRFAEMGFDIFDDVIDHSYQNYDTLIERCYYAFQRNLHILTDIEYACKIRTTMMDRLNHNQWLLENNQIDKFCKQQINQWPIDLQQAIADRLLYWLHN
jgi:hypothetical protein